MIRVAFIIDINNIQWNGGLNYYRNLINAVCDLPDNRISPVIITGLSVDESVFKDYHNVEIVKTNILERYYPGWFLQRSVDRLFSRDLLLERLLIKNQIELLSHSQFVINPHPAVPVCAWIPDFQQLHMPDFFTKKEIVMREIGFKNLCMRSNRVILSSYDAQNDLSNFVPETVGKSRVLQFVAYPQSEAKDIDLRTIEQKYDLKGPFFLIPNQFWIHKNHRIIVEALRILKSRNRDVLILATGKTGDYRQPNYYYELMTLARDYGISQFFRPLGVIPYTDLTNLMINSISMLNPSLFEGWSTSVEEAKSLGKHIILSDIPIHREQAPAYAIYFDPHNAEQLADILWNRALSYDSSVDLIHRQQAEDQFPHRWYSFGKTYKDIVMDALGY